MGEVCGDNRFEIIENAKKRLIEATNIEDRPDEMAVIDSVLFRMWQMGWLPGCERTTTRSASYKTKYGRRVPLCVHCGYSIGDTRYNYCPQCGAKVVD